MNVTLAFAMRPIFRSTRKYKCNGMKVSLFPCSGTRFVEMMRRSDSRSRSGLMLRMFSSSASSSQRSSTGDTHVKYAKDEDEDGCDEYDPFIDPSMELVRDVAEKIRRSVRDYTSQSQSKVQLIGIIASRISVPDKAPIVDTSADTYSEWIAKTCMEDGIQYDTWRVAGGTSSTIRQIENLIQRANQLKEVHGVLVYYPLYNKPYVLGLKHHGQGRGRFDTNNWSLEQQRLHIEMGCEDVLRKLRYALPGLSYKTRDDCFRDSILPSRDVEGLSPTYHSRNIFRNNELYVDRYNGEGDGDGDDSLIFCNSGTGESNENFMIFPCTALAVVRVLKQCLDAYDPTKPIGARFEGVTVTIINRSEILGRPLASMLANDGATVYSIDADSILCYKPNGRMKRLFNGPPSDLSKTIQSCVEESSVVVTAVPSSAGFKLPSDWIRERATVINVASEPNVDENELRNCNVTYIPQIGKVTVALLESNLVQLHRQFHSR